MRSFRVILCLFLIGIITSSCSKSDEGISKEDLIGDYDRYIVWTTEGQNYSVGINLNPTAAPEYGTGTSISGTSCDHNLGPLFHPSDKSMPSASVNFVKFHGDYCGGFEENSRFHTFFNLGEYDLTNKYQHGIFFNLSLDFSNDEVNYSSSLGEQPDGNYVRITESESDNIEFYPGAYDFGQIVTGEFQIRVYNWENPEEYIDIKNGLFKVRVEPYYSQGRLD